MTGTSCSSLLRSEGGGTEVRGGGGGGGGELGDLLSCPCALLSRSSREQSVRVFWGFWFQFFFSHSNEPFAPAANSVP